VGGKKGGVLFLLSKPELRSHVASCYPLPGIIPSGDSNFQNKFIPFRDSNFQRKFFFFLWSKSDVWSQIVTTLMGCLLVTDFESSSSVSFCFRLCI
jgi:hypothetical protein